MTLNDLVSDFARYIRRLNDVDVTQMPGLAAGTNDATLKTVTAIIYKLYNQEYQKIATDNIAMTACAAQAKDTFCYYLVSLDVSGNVTVTKGTDNVYALPSTPQGNCAIGALLVTTVGVTFTSGTDKLTDTGITSSFYDIDTGMAANFITKAQRSIEYGITVPINGHPVRCKNWDHMKARATVIIDEGDTTFTNPITNYKEFIEARLTDVNGQIWPRLKKEDRIHVGLVGLEGRPIYIGRLPNIETTFTPDAIPTFEFTLWPQSDATYSLDLDAYQYTPTLDGVIYPYNWWSLNAPEALLYGALVEAAPYLQNDERIAVWKGKLQETLAGIWVSQQDEKYAGSPLNIKFSDPFRRRVGNIYSFIDAEGG